MMLEEHASSIDRVGEYLQTGIFSPNSGGAIMTTEPRLSSNSQTLGAAGRQPETMGLSDSSRSAREVDERTAVYLLSLARELLRRDHSAIAGMIDYAIVEIEGGADQ